MSKRKKITIIFALSVLVILSGVLIYGVITGRISSFADLVLAPNEKIVARKSTLDDFLKMEENGLNLTIEGAELEKLALGSKRLSEFKRLGDIQQKRSFPVVLEVQGTIFVLGGSGDDQNGSTEVYRAKFNRENENLEVFAEDDKSLPLSLFAGGGASVNNFLYYIGGKTKQSGENTLSNKIYTSNVYIDANPKLNIDWTWAGDLPVYLSEMGTCVRNEFVYVMGGVSSNSGSIDNDSDLVFSRKVYFSKAEKSGVLNDWEETSELPIPLYRIKPVVVGDRIYIFGGGTSVDARDEFFSENNQEKTNIVSSNKVFFAEIKEDGSLSDWEELLSLPQARQGHFTFFANGNVYLISGYSFLGREDDENKFEDLKDQIQVAKINPDSGEIESFSGNSEGATPSFLGNDAIFNGGSIVVSGNAVIFAGEEKFGGVKSASKRIYSASLIKGNEYNQSLSSFGRTKDMPAERYMPELVSYKGHLYVTGGGDGDGNTGTNTLFVAKAESNGVSDWQTHTLPQEYLGHESVILNGFLYILGGINKAVEKDPDTVYSDVYFANILEDGSVSEFKKTKKLPKARWQFASTTLGSRIYILGGQEGTSDSYSRTKSVYFAEQNIDGTISDWQKSSEIPVALDRIDAVTLGNYIYIAGGIFNYVIGDPVGAVNSVYFAEIKPDGTLKEFKKTVSLPTRRAGANLVSVKGGLVLLGGYNFFRTLTYNNLYAPIKRNGEISCLGWQEIANPDSYFFGGAADKIVTEEGNSYLYFVGGHDFDKRLLGEDYISKKVFFSKLESDEIGGTYSSVGYISGRFNLQEKQEITRLVWNVLLSEQEKSSGIKKAFAEDLNIPENSDFSLRIRFSAEGDLWSDWTDFSSGDFLNIGEAVQFVEYEGLVFSSEDRNFSPEIKTFALTFDESGGGGDSGREKELAGEFGDRAGTAGIETSGALPGTGVSFGMVLIISAILVLMGVLSWEFFKKKS